MPSTTDISPLSITDGKISNEARIAHSKLAKAVEGQVLVAQADGKFAAKSLAGDVTLDSSGNTTSNVAVSSDGTTVVTGATGATGEKGATGSQGAAGATGPAGSDATVTEATVNAAGAVMHTDFPESTGFIKRGASSAAYTIDNSTYSTTDHDHTLADISDAGGAAALDVWAAVGPPAGTVCAGDDGRLGDTRDPNSHKASHSTGGTDVLSPSDIGASADDHTHGYSSLTGIPTAFAPSSHNHDHNELTNYAVGQHRVINDSGTSSTELWSASNVNYHLGGKEPTIGSKNTAFNKNFGTGSGDVCQGNDGRLSDTRTPSSTLTHKATHATGGSDALSPADIGASADDHTHSAYVNVKSDWDATTGDAKILNKPTVQYESAIADATTSAAGLMSSTDKTKLDGVPTLGDSATKDVGAASDEVAQGNHTHAAGTTSAAGFISTTDKTKLDACLEVDDTSSAATNTWSAEKIAAIINDGTSSFTNAWSSSKVISYLATFYATLSNGFSNHKYTAAIQWERTLAISSTGWAQGSGSGAWQANQNYSSLAQTSATGSGTGALFNVGVDVSGVPTFTWVSGGGGYAVSNQLTFTDPGSTSQTCVVTVTAVTTPTGISFSGTTGSMTCNINHDLGTEYITMSVRDKDDVIEDLGHIPIVTVIDADNVKLEYGASDYPNDVGEDKFITIIG